MITEQGKQKKERRDTQAKGMNIRINIQIDYI